MMRDAHIGNVVVVEDRKGKKVPIGVITDRDISADRSDSCSGRG
jgi:hypothetical protein